MHWIYSMNIQHVHSTHLEQCCLTTSMQQQYIDSKVCNYLQLFNEKRAHSQLFLSSADFATSVIIGCCRTCNSNAFFCSVNQSTNQRNNKSKPCSYSAMYSKWMRGRQCQRQGRLLTFTVGNAKSYQHVQHKPVLSTALNTCTDAMSKQHTDTHTSQTWSQVGPYQIPYSYSIRSEY